ncbi:MATE family efflux transporter [Spirochaetia bacterium]|nr:MATE family efflux transporter [Spirochaetia bacterium]
MKLPAFLDNKDFYKKLFTIAIPIMLQNLVNAFVNMIDTVMIGRLGTVEIAAVGLGNNIFFFYMIILFGICSGGSIFTAQFWGKHDISGIRKNVGLLMVISLCVGVLFTLAAALIPYQLIGIYSRDPEVIKAGGLYLKFLAPSFLPFAISQVFVLSLRSIEKVQVPMITTAIALSVNVVLNYFLIFGIGPFPMMGVAGAAVATVIARFVETGALVAVSYRRKYAIAGSLRELTGFNSFYLRRFFSVALPVIINEIIWSAGIITQNIIFARTGTDAIAAFNITGTVSQLTWTLFIGMGNGVSVLIGKKIGEGDHAAARDYASRIIRFAPLVAVGAVCVLIPISALIPFIFNVNEGVIAAASLMFIILAISYPFRAFNMAMVIGICRAGGDTVFCAIYDVAFMWAVALPAAAIASFVFHAPVWLIYLLVLSEDPLKVVLGFWRYRSGKWLHNVTEDMS